eukprot:PhM_4_TR10084/c1_g1_i1/m.75558
MSSLHYFNDGTGRDSYVTSTLHSGCRGTTALPKSRERVLQFSPPFQSERHNRSLNLLSSDILTHQTRPHTKQGGGVSPLSRSPPRTPGRVAVNDGRVACSNQFPKINPINFHNGATSYNVSPHVGRAMATGGASPSANSTTSSSSLPSVGALSPVKPTTAVHPSNSFAGMTSTSHSATAGVACATASNAHNGSDGVFVPKLRVPTRPAGYGGHQRGNVAQYTSY